MKTAQTRAVTEDDLIEYILKVLFSNLDKNEMHLEKDIIVPTQIQLNERELEHIREILMSTHLVKNSVGFGKNGFVYLTASGIQVMKQYKSYHNFLKATNGETHPQIIGNYQQLTPENQSQPDKNQGEDAAHYDDMAH